MKKVLIGSPIRQKPAILKEFLNSLIDLDKDDISVSYYFIDDNSDAESSKLLSNFQKKNENVKIDNASSFSGYFEREYNCDAKTHHWKKDIINKVILFKNKIIEFADKEKFDYLFFIDSDIVLNKLTLKHLISRNKDIISEVFWTEWVVGGIAYPQVWIQDENAYFKRDWDNSNVSKKERNKKANDFIVSMKIPGVYEVGGLGACTLISKKVLNSGVNFSLIDNVSFWGEDRHFCIRAMVNGFKLYVDTVYPAYHIYREEYLNRVSEFKKDGFKWDMCRSTKKGNSLIFKIKNRFKKMKANHKGLKYKIKKWGLAFVKWNYKRKRIVKKENKVVLSMVVHNEAGKYLKTILENAKQYVDAVLIIDDASTDNTVEECEEVLKDFPHNIVKNKVSLFSQEYKLRRLQWDETVKMKPTWILTLDADEIPEKDFKQKLNAMINNKDIDIFNFRLFDLWNDKQYRSDSLWNSHNNYRTYLVRYQPKMKVKYLKKNQHCGTFPYTIRFLPSANVDVRIKHYGWVDEESRKAKYERYMKLDADGKFGNLAQYKSILDEKPNLIDFEE